MSTEFKWDDSLIKEFLSENFFSYALNQTLEERLNKFKESKQPKLEWEIISYRHKLTKEITPKTSTVFHKAMFNNEHEIYSAQRLSDGEVFTIEDKFLANAGCQLTIIKFEVSGDNRIRVYSKEYGYWFLNEIRKPALFTSQDGKPIFKDDKFYYVDKSFRINEYLADSCWTPVQDGLEFSTKDAAEDYILHHKPTISLSQVLLRYSMIFGKNDEFAESMKNIAFKAVNQQTTTNE